MDIKPIHLRTLGEVERTGTIAAAADSLGYTPSAVSQQMAALEKTVGRQVLEPIGRTVRLTHAGQVLVRHARLVLDALEETQAALEASDSDLHAELQVGVFESFASTLLPLLLDRLATSHPELRICAQQIEPLDATEAVATSTLDAAFVPDFASRATDRELDQTHVFRDWFRLIVAKDDPIKSNRINLTQLDGRDLIGETYVFQACRDAGFEPIIRHQLHDYPAILRIVAASDVAAFVPDLALAHGHAEIRTIDPSPSVHRDIHLVTRPSSSKRPAIAALRTTITQIVDQLGLDTKHQQPRSTGDAQATATSPHMTNQQP